MSGLIGFTLSLFLFLSIAVLRVCIEDRRSFAESRRACTGEYRRFVGRGVYRRFAGSDIVRSVGRLIARFVSFRRRFGEGAPSGVVVRLAELRLDARANVWMMMGWLQLSGDANKMTTKPRYRMVQSTAIHHNKAMQSV